MSTAAQDEQMSSSFTYELEDVKDPTAHKKLLLALATCLPHSLELRELCSHILKSTNIEQVRRRLLPTFDCIIVANSLHPVCVAQSTLDISERPSLTKLTLPDTFPSEGWELASRQQMHRRSLGHLECFKHLRALMQSVPQGTEWPDHLQLEMAGSVKRLADNTDIDPGIRSILGKAVEEYNSASQSRRGDKYNPQRSAAFVALRDVASAATQAIAQYAFTVETTPPSRLCLQTMCYTLSDTRTIEQMLKLVKDVHEQCRSDTSSKIVDLLEGAFKSLHTRVNEILPGEDDFQNKIKNLRAQNQDHSQEGAEGDDHSEMVANILKELEIIKADARSLVDESIVLTLDHQVWGRHLSGFRNRRGSGNIKLGVLSSGSSGVTLVDPPLRFPERGWTLANDDQRRRRRCGHDGNISLLSTVSRLGHVSKWNKVKPTLLLEQTKTFLELNVSTAVHELLSGPFKSPMDRIAAAYKDCDSKFQEQETTQTLKSLPEFIALHDSVDYFLLLYSHYVFTVAPEEVDPTAIEPASDASPLA